MCVACFVRMARAAHPEWFSGRQHRLSLASRRILIASALILAFAFAVLLWTRWSSRGEAQLEQLSDPERRALYDRTRADLELCATAAGATLGDHCRHQAELILRFSECDAACRELANVWQKTPKR
jgi:cytochrome b pre-mRNA-processing protein 3